MVLVVGSAMVAVDYAQASKPPFDWSAICLTLCRHRVLDVTKNCSAAGDPMFYHHVPLSHGILVLTVVMLLHWAMSVLTDRSERAEDVLEGEPVLVVENGAVVESAVGVGSMSRRS
ncbi:hypothetical protein [Citreimonas salinaria]|uniref:Uncharacterized protein n=1 Tax=Citreimonas salinaria TaxID=321339 RepID=A0A1H3M516_9RHOB|nr:hypothetical protein [Citreimonas salinaria]SDY71328.1 hypothetical protein SAMN05444340_11599 [Citreimonas salinaria]